MRIDGVSTNAIPVTPPTRETGPSGNFADLMTNAVTQLNRSQLHVENLIERSAAGETINSAVLASAINKADIAWRTMIQIRNKLTNAFDELRQMQV